MATKNFLLTYSVSPNSSKYDSDAEKIRAHIRDFDGYINWNRIENLETVLKGTLDVRGTTSEQRDDAKDQVRKLFRAVFEESNISSSAYNNIHIYIALLVDGLGTTIELQV